MAKKKQSNAAPTFAKGGRSSQALSKLVLRGRGDYDVVEQAVPAIGEIAKETNRLASRVSRLENSSGSMSSTAKSSVGQAAGALGKIAGSALGNGSLGQLAGERLASYFGYGDYEVKHNSLMGVSTTAGLKFEKDGRRGTRIVEREYVGDIFSGGTLVNGATTFDLRSFSINPGMSDTFPWLSNIAAQFEQYVPNGIIFEFKSTSSVYNGTNQALGALIVATDYDASDAPYINKLQMESADYAMSCKASDSLLHGVECDPSERGDDALYVRSGAVASNDNVKFYDLGNFQIATQGMSAAGVNLGELWVSYDFTFYKKQLVSGQLGYNLPFFSCYGTSGISLANPLGVPSYKAGNLPITIAGDKFTFPRYIQSGIYECVFISTAASWSGAFPILASFSNCTNVNNSLVGNPSSVDWTVIATASGQALAVYLIRVTGPGAVVQIITSTPTSPVWAQLRVCQFNGLTPWPVLP